MKNNKNIKITFLVFTTIIFAVSSYFIFSPKKTTIYKANSLNLIWENTKNLNENSLVIFDVDDTIITATTKEIHTTLTKEKKSYIQGNKDQETLSLLFTTTDSQIIEPTFSQLIATLKEKNVKVIALTALVTGKFGSINSLEDWRINQLISLGIDFNFSFPNNNLISFTSYTNEDGTPLFKNGVLFSSLQSKGKMLQAFLEKIQWKPKKIIFVDDKLKQVQDVEKIVKNLNINFIGIYYTGVKKLLGKNITIALPIKKTINV